MNVERITVMMNALNVPMLALLCVATPSYHLFLSRKLIIATGNITAIVPKVAPTKESVIGESRINKPANSCAINTAGTATIPIRYVASTFNPCGINNKLA